MQPAQKLTRALRSLITLVEEEASRNPDFAQRLEAIVSDLPSAHAARKPQKAKPSEPETPPPDVLGACEAKGEDEFRFWLRDFDIATLKAIIRSNGFDPGKSSQRWTEPDKFIALIVEQSVARLRRGSSFLPPKGAEPQTPSA
ncbi:MAG: hypothetical protein J0L73_18025 [Verrucomicrobia bacterium]|nr:hypothetical protein [Verrucomicrobiota bacterium]